MKNLSNRIKESIVFLLEAANKRRKFVLALSCLVVFVTTYVLILPAFTLDSDKAKEQGGIDVPAIAQEDESRDKDAAAEDASDNGQDAGEAQVKSGEQKSDNDKSKEALSADDSKDAGKDASGAKESDKSDAGKAGSESASAEALSFEGKGFAVAVADKSSVLPGDTKLVVEELGQETKSEAKSYQDYCDKALAAINEDAGTKATKTISFVKLYDISLQSSGDEINPDKPVDVTISYDKDAAKELKVNETSDVHIVHFAKDEETGKVTAELVDQDNVDVTLDKSRMTETTFEAESFSVYGVVYTVDFHYSVDGKSYDYGFSGGNAASIRELTEALHIVDSVDSDIAKSLGEDVTADVFVREIEKVEFSDESLVKVAQITEDTTAGQLKDSLGLKPEYSKELTDEDIAKIDEKAFKAPDWALISLKPFDTEETLTITMKNGDVFTVKVTDDQATDPLGLNNETFVITNGNHDRSLKAQADSNAGSLQAQNPPSADAINVWKFEYDEEAFNGTGGYYIVSTINDETRYLRVDGNNLTLAPVRSTDDTEPGQAVATPFHIAYDHEKLRYRISGADDGNSKYITYVTGGYNGRFSLSNTASDNNLLAFRDHDHPTTTPGTVGTWDIKSDNIVLKLFDYQGTVSYTTGGSNYWDPVVYHNNENIDDAWGADVTYQQLRNGTGINSDRSLLFSGSGLGGGESFNNFTGDKSGGTFYSGYAFQDIVNHNLGTDRFPVLQSGNIKTTTDRNSGGSLAYLFNNNSISNAKTVYAGQDNKGLQGLLRKNEDGYYYYDSEENFAKLVGDEVILYSDTYKKNNSSSTDIKTSKIGLFPFDNYQSNQGEEKGPSGSVYNHQFGMTISTDFVYPPNGIVPDTQKPMTFEFSGDDDVWVFVDGVLVLDLGGVHQPISGKIDFATGNVTITEFGSNGVEYTSSKSTTISQMFAKASQEAGRTIAFNADDYSAHKLEFFYLERGGCDSNCKISFNLLMMKTLTVAKKLNGLTPAERIKYMQDEFLYELGLKHSKDGIPMHNNEDEYWDDTSWRNGFSTYSTEYTDRQSDKNYTIKTLSDGTTVNGLPVNDGQISLKANEKMTITHLPKTDIFYLAEENQLDMKQFETPHAERMYLDATDMKSHEEEVHLHQDTAAGGSHKSDWETRPYALEDTENLVYTNTLQERNIDVKKLWADGNENHESDPVKFKLKAKVLDGTEGGKDYKTFMEEYNSAKGTNYSTNINAQWTEKTSSGVVTRTENVLNKEYDLKTANDWLVSFEHLPKKTQSPDSEGFDIEYSVEEVSSTTNYTSEVGDIQDADKVYVDIFKFWPDDNSNHRGDKAETFTVRIKDSNGNTIRAIQDSNGEWKYTSKQNEGTTDITFGPNASNEMFDYAARVNNLPRYNEDGSEITYTFEQVGDNDKTTTGLVMFTRPAEDIEILNTPQPVDVTIEKVDKGNPSTVLKDAVFQLYKINSSGADEKFENAAFDLEGEGEDAKHTGTFTLTNGRLTINDLIAGRYHLQEVEPPDGYIIENADSYFTVSSKGTVTLTDADGNAISTTSDSLVLVNGTTITVKNESGAELPQSGGMGTTIFYVFGAILAIGCGIGLISRRRAKRDA